ncbi:Slowpoke-binding protein [Geodia barretti]|uniref:Slowpoke-binding protein n=1 Tax=Geodia barretti TaxID=519541 RepID=A0AA35S1E5_GEOBA|nr:Slowpoke-binding protein [Geodia barretti]
MASSADKYVRENYWVVAVVGVIFVLISVTILVSCVLCWFVRPSKLHITYSYYISILLYFTQSYHRRRKRRRNGVYYVNLRANLEDSLQYGSIELQKSLNDASTSASTSFNTSSSPSVTSSGKPKKREVGVAESWTNERKRREVSEREAANLACQYYLRNTKSYTLTNPLPDLGSRVAKYWFLVSARGQGSSQRSQRILTLQPVSKHCPIRLQRENVTLLNELLVTLKHPFLHSLEHVDYLPEHSSVVMVMTFFPQGSLKDLIYKRQPTLEWSEKYSIRRRGLPPATVALYGRQILEALRILYRKGFPPLGNLQSGNVFIDGSVCRLSGYENTVLGYRSRHHRLVRDHSDSMDSIMFGHLLFEMMCGYELTTLSPSNSDMTNVNSEAQIELLNLPFFKSVKLPEMDNWDSSQIQLSAEMKGLLRGVRKGRSEFARDREKSASQRRSFSKQDNYYPVTPAPQSSSTPGTSSQSTQRPSPPTSHPPPPSSSSQHAPSPSSTEERGVLLTQIRRGSKLKKAVTNDRSAPRI